MALNVKPYNADNDTIEIEGTLYSAHLFRTLGCSFPNMIGQVFRIDEKENGCVTVTRLPQYEEEVLIDRFVMGETL
jgi:hypothetical protein